MERSREAPPSSSTETEVPSLPEVSSSPEEPVALSALIQRVQEPDANRVDVDALLAGISRPLAPEQSPRQHADLLLSLIEDPHLGSFSGHSGRTVRTVAVRALLELGYPYALEVPPDALEAAAAAPDPETPPIDFPARAWGGLLLMVVIGLVELTPFALSSSSDSGWMMLLIASTNIFPATLAAVGRGTGVRLLQGLGLIWLLIVGILWVLLGLAVLFGSLFGLIPLGIGALTLGSTALLDSRKR